ncbi:MAG TPA: hypothetical protein VKV25_02145 [Acidimicrobiales bacterium]|nr:hypothetical protein [Acidimicrobiales bacterium]
MTLVVRAGAGGPGHLFERGHTVRIGRGEGCDLRVGEDRVSGRWTVSSHHADVTWDGERWTTRNVSGRSGLLRVYEPGWEELVLEPGRTWAATRHRWSYAFGRPRTPFPVVCSTDDHRGTTGGEPGDPDDADDDATAMFPAVTGPVLTDLERSVALAYYGAFVALPRPASLATRSHAEAAVLLGRSTDSARKAIERLNEKIARRPDAPAAARGRAVSDEIGRWLARSGVLDPVEMP